AHQVPAHLDVPDLLHLQHPARGHPGPGAQRVEPEVDGGGGGLLGHVAPHGGRGGRGPSSGNTRSPPGHSRLLPVRGAWQDRCCSAMSTTHEECRPCPVRICPATRPGNGPPCCRSTGTRCPSTCAR